MHPRGWFEIDSIVPGRYGVAVTLESDSEAAAVVEEVEVRAGLIVRDPRLAIDLRSLARVFVLRVVDAAGEPIEHGTIEARSEKREWDQVGWFQNGKGMAYTAWPSVDVRLAAEGFWPLHATLRGDVSLVLHSATPMRFHWASPPPDEGRATRFEVALCVQEPGVPDRELELDVFDEPVSGWEIPLPTARALVQVVWRRLDYDPFTEDWAKSLAAVVPLPVPVASEPVDQPLEMPVALRAAIEAAPPLED